MRGTGEERPRVLVTRRIPEPGLSRVRADCDAVVWPEPRPMPREALLEQIGSCVGLLAMLTDRIDDELLDRAPRLRVVSNYAVGVDNVDVEAATARGIPVGHTPDVLTEATADVAFALLIAAARRVVEGHRFVAAGHWKTWDPEGQLGLDLVGKTLGVIGMGRIGTALARRCRGGWNMRVLYCNRGANPRAERELQAVRVPLERLLGESDFVSVHASLNPSTVHLIDAAALARMKPTAVLVNTARGALVDPDALVHALREGQIFAAGLDVTEPEPLPGDHPLLKLDSCVVLPHVGSATTGTRAAMAEIAADNLLRGVQGEPLRHRVPSA